MRVDLHLPAGWSKRVNLEALRAALLKVAQGVPVSLPPEPPGGPEILPVEIPDELAEQFPPDQIESWAKRIIAATLSDEKSRRTRGPHLSESARENLGIILDLLIPLIALALLIWLLGRGPQAASGFASWPGGGAAA